MIVDICIFYTHTCGKFDADYFRCHDVHMHSYILYIFDIYKFVKKGAAVFSYGFDRGDTIKSDSTVVV